MHIKAENYKSPLNKLFALFISLLVFIVALHFVDSEGSYVRQLWADGIFAILIIVFLVIDFQNVKTLFRFRNFSFKRLLTVVLIAPAFAFLIHHFAEFINTYVFKESVTGYLHNFADAPYPLLIAIISIGVFPGLFEEIGFRGVVFNHLLKITRLKTSILLSAALFTLIHLSFVSYIWIFPIGLALGYLRARYRTIWYGVIGHFLYNTSIILLEYFYA